MRMLIAAVAIAVVALVAAPPRAAADSTAKGTVASVGADSLLTVRVDGKDMTFKVTEKTSVIARGATTATKLAHQKGETGPEAGRPRARQRRGRAGVCGGRGGDDRHRGPGHQEGSQVGAVRTLGTPRQGRARPTTMASRHDAWLSIVPGTLGPRSS